MTEGIFPKTDGDILYGSEANNMFVRGNVQEVYTGNGYDTNGGSNSQELNFIKPGSLNGATYIQVTALGQTSVYNNAGAAGETSIKMKMETKGSGGTYSDAIGWHILAYSPGGVDLGGGFTSTPSINIIHTLTGSELNDGIYIQMSASGVTNGGIARWTNTQTVVSTF